MAWPRTPWAISNPLNVSPRDSARSFSAGFARRQSTDSGKYPFATWGMATAAIATIIALVAGIFLSIPIFVLDSSPVDGDSSTWASVATQFLTGAGFLLVSFMVSLAYGGNVRDVLGRLGFHRFRLSTAAKWIAIGIASYLAFNVIYSQFITPEQDNFTGDFGPIWIQVLLVVVLAPISEEVCFRAMLFGGFRNRFSMWPAALMAGAFFGLLHATTGWSAVPVLIFFGIVLAVVYEKTESIWPPILVHLLNNAVALTSLQS